MTTDDSPSTGPWLEIAVEVAGIDAEIAADLLRQACPGGVAIETPSRLDRETETYVADGDSPALVKGYVRPDADIDRIRRGLEVALQHAPLQRSPVWHETRTLAEEDWRDAWKKYFDVQRIGKRLLIVPSWVENTPKPDDIVLSIDPGMAFGTGQHPTTAMCLAALEDTITGGERLLDLGCGSGILAIAAARLGATSLLALDIDPLAVKAAGENAANNNVDIETREATLELLDQQFDVIVANISGLTLERLASRLCNSLTPGGKLIASGFLDEAVGGLRKAFESAGLRVNREIEDGIWRALVVERP
ncbi:MAG: 50S ribosomal protein L11 methyltransferase [Chloroflexota bacterium]